MVGSTTLLRILLISFHAFFAHFFNISFEGACSPLNHITDTNAMSILSSVMRDLMLINILPLVHLNGPPNISLQILALTTLRNDLVPSRTPFRPAPSPTSLFLPSWDGNPAYGGQDPSGLDICSSTCQYSGKSEIWDVPNVMIGLGFIDDDPVGDSDAKPRPYHFLKEQNQRASHFMINANIHDNPVWATLLPLCSQRAGYGRSDIGQQSSTRHADWCDQYSHFLLSLLTCLRPTSSPPHIAEVQEPSATLPPSALNAATPNPVLPPSLPCTEATPMPTQPRVL